MTAPIVLFAYARPDHLRRTIEALQLNALANDSDLIVFSDAARTSDQESGVATVRNYLSSIKGFRSISLHHRTHNLGLARSIITGVTIILEQYERVIVLEDDMVTSPYFLSYMNDALERFAGDELVASIHGYLYPVKEPMPEAFFLPGADCWGWATWRRGWALFNPDGQALLDEMHQRGLMKDFDFGGAYPYSTMLKEQIAGKNDSWAIRWYASAFLAGKLTLYPGRSLIQNIGHDASGTHCGADDLYAVELSASPINLDGVQVAISPAALQAFSAFFRWTQGGLLNRLKRRLSKLTVIASN